MAPTKITPKATATAEGGRLIFAPDQIDVYSRLLQSLSGPVEIIIRKERKDRSDLQNRYFHGCVCPIIADKLYELGLISAPDPVIAKEILKAKFLKSFVDVKGDQIEYVHPTHLLSTADFEQFMTDCRMWGDFIGCYVPSPNEVAL